MKIGNEAGTQSLTTINQQNDVQEIKSQPEDHNNTTASANISAFDHLSLSTEGKLSQEIDATSDEIDQILERHLTPDQKKDIESIYKKLDELFEKDKLTIKEESLAESLFEKVHNTLETSIEKLSDEEHVNVDELAKKMVTLTLKLENVENSTFSITFDNKKNHLFADMEHEAQISKKTLTVAELNDLPTNELNKLPANQLRKLNEKQLNRLNSAQLNGLAVAQLKKLSPS